MTLKDSVKLTSKFKEMKMVLLSVQSSFLLDSQATKSEEIVVHSAKMFKVMSNPNVLIMLLLIDSSMHIQTVLEILLVDA